MKKSNSLMMVQFQLEQEIKESAQLRNNTTPSSLDRWIHQYEKSGSFQENDNSSLEQEEHLMLRKELEQQQMVNDILKQASYSPNTRIHTLIVF